MKIIKIVVGAVLVLGIAVGIFALIKMSPSSSSGDSDDQPVVDNTPPLVTVQVGTLKRMTLHSYIDGYGTVEAAPATANEPAAGGTLAAPSAGVVAKVNVIPGQHVEKGDVLAELNSSTATFDYAKAELERQNKLFAQQNTAIKNVEDAKAQLASLQVVAPVSGTVTRVDVKPGQAVDSTTIIAEVVDLNRLAVSTKIPAKQADELHIGQKVQILTDPPVTASLSLINPAVNADDGTIAAWASLPSDSQLRSGQFVQLKIVTAATNCLAAPAESVVTDEDGNSFISLVNTNVSAKTQVQVGFREDGWVEVNAPELKEGSQVVTVGAYGLDDKTQLKIASPAQSDSETNSADTK